MFGPWELTGIALFAAAMSVGAWAALRTRRLAMARLGRAAGAVGLARLGTGQLHGRAKGRQVRLTRVHRPDCEAVLAVQLGPDWDASFVATSQGVSALRPAALEGSSGVRAGLAALFDSFATAEVRHGAVVVRLPEWPDEPAALKEWVDSVVREAERLDAAAAEALGAWKKDLATLGLTEQEGRLSGAFRGCEVEISRHGALRAPLGPDLPPDLEIGARPGGWRRWLERPSLRVEGLESLAIRTAQSDRIRRLLADPELRSTLLSLFTRFPAARIGGGRLVLPLERFLAKGPLEAGLDVVTAFIRQLQRLTDWPGKGHRKREG